MSRPKLTALAMASCFALTGCLATLPRIDPDDTHHNKRPIQPKASKKKRGRT
jgi:hypothetical protein